MTYNALQTEKLFVNNKIEKKFSRLKNKIKFNSKKILIMGLPGTGKTTLAKELTKYLPVVHLNADEIRSISMIGISQKTVASGKQIECSDYQII